MKHLVAVLHIGELLLEKLGSRKRYISKTETIQKISYYYFSHSYHLGFSIYHLTKIGYDSAAIILTRTLLEMLIDFSYLWLCKDINGIHTDEREAWMRYDAVRREGIETKWDQMQDYRINNGLPVVEPMKIFNQEVSDLINDQKIEFKNKFNRRHWALFESLDKRARAVDKTNKLSTIDFEKTYVLSYKWSSELVHGESASANVYMSFDVDSGLNIDFGPTGKKSSLAISMSAHFLSEVFYLVNHLNNLGINIQKQFECYNLNFSTEENFV